MSKATRVLVVDDDQQSRELYADFLRSEGHDVVARGDRHSAEATIKASRFDFAVLDYEIPLDDDPQALPHMRHGLELMRFVAKQHVPFVVLTGVAKGAREAIAAVRAGALDYYFKAELDSPDKIAAKIHETRAQTDAVRADGKLPLRARAYADCHVLLSKDSPDQVLLAVRGQQQRVKAKPNRSVMRLLYEISLDQPRNVPSSFSGLYQVDSSLRSAVGRTRDWLRSCFDVTAPADREAPLVNVPAAQRGAPQWVCDVRVLAPEQDFAHEREAQYREEATRRTFQRKRDAEGR